MIRLNFDAPLRRRKPLTKFVEAFACSNYDPLISSLPRSLMNRTCYEAAAYQYGKNYFVVQSQQVPPKVK
jgi:hypothetical protein